LKNPGGYINAEEKNTDVLGKMDITDEIGEIYHNSTRREEFCVLPHFFKGKKLAERQTVNSYIKRNNIERPYRH